MKHYFIFLFLAGTLLLSCTKAKMIADTYITVSYKQTYCADAWATGTTDSITANNLSAYLNSANLYVAGISIRTEAIGETCLACQCKTGKTIYVSTLDSDSIRAQYARIGFK